MERQTKKTYGKISEKDYNLVGRKEGMLGFHRRSDIWTVKNNSILRKSSVVKCLESIECGLLYSVCTFQQNKKFQHGGKKIMKILTSYRKGNILFIVSPQGSIKLN